MANGVLHVNPSPKDFGKEWTKLQGASMMSNEVLKKYFAHTCAFWDRMVPVVNYSVSCLWKNNLVKDD